MKVYRYEDSEESVNGIITPVVFLAGPTVRGNQPHLTSWRFEAIEEFKKQGFKGALIVPEFSTKTESDKGKEWIPMWEYNGLKKADCIMFWIPRTRELIALTTNMEFGFWQGRQPSKMVYGRPDDAYRIGYLDVMWKAVANETNGYNPAIYNSIGETIAASIATAEFYNEHKIKSLNDNR
jgi:nucleoside 2-deoxyribosyltransferase